MALVHVFSIFFFVLTGLLLAAGERFKGTLLARRSVLTSFVTLLAAVGLMLMHVPESSGGLMDPYQSATPHKKKNHAAGASVGEDEEDDKDDKDDGGGDNGPQSKSADAGGADASPAAKGDDKEKPFKDCEDCPELVFVPSGHVEIGSSASDRRSLPSEVPQRDLSQDALAVARHEISADEFGVFLNAMARWPRVCPVAVTAAASASPTAPAESTRPAAVCLTWKDAHDYARWLSMKTGKRYFLPSAAQWEYVARYELTDGQQKLNVLNMGGGVAEFVADCWRDKPDTEAEAQGMVPWTPGCDRRVVKDGADDEEPRWRRAAARRAMDGKTTSIHVGFRVMRAGN